MSIKPWLILSHMYLLTLKKEKRREKKIEEKKSEEKLVANTKHFLIYALFLYTEI